MRLHVHLIGWMVFALATRCAFGQESVDSVFVDMSVPDSPAFVALGVTPSEVSRPGSPRELGVQLLDLVDASGRVRNGVSMDFAPYLVLQGSRLSLRSYQERTAAAYLRRVAVRTQVSLGTTVASGGGEASGASNMALGVRLTLVDQGDPRLDTTLIGALASALAIRDAPAGPPTGVGEAREITDADILHEIEKAREAARARNWNATRWDVGLAPTFASPDGSIDSIAFDMLSAWTSLSLRLGGWGQLIWQARYSPAVEMPGGTLFATGWRLRAGTGTWGYVLEGAYKRSFADDDLLEDEWGRIVSGLEVRLSNGLWLEAVFGGEFDRDVQPSRLLTAANLKWAFSKDRLHSPSSPEP